VGGKEALAEKCGIDAVRVVAFAYDTYTNPSKNNGVLRATLTNVGQTRTLILSSNDERSNGSRNGGRLLQDYFFFDFLAVDFLVELLEDFFFVLLDWDFFLEAEGFLEALAFFDEGV